jgi:hypothetical protein
MSFIISLGFAFPLEQLNFKRGSNNMNLLRKFVPAPSRIQFYTLIAICLMSFLAVSVHATTYTVKAGGGGNYTTIQACANAMSAGDTCTVYAGTYNENVTVSAGTSGNIKTMTVNSGDTVNVLSFTINSYATVNGFTITNPSSPNSQACVTLADNSNYWSITNNTMTECGNGYMIKVADITGVASYGLIKGNTLSWSCSTSSSPNVCTAIGINGNYNLLDSNNISHVSDGPYIFGTGNVLRKNNLGPTSDADCGSQSSNCHIDFMQSDANVQGGAQPSQNLLMEGNTVHDMTVTGSFSGSGAHAGPLLQAEACNGGCHNAILRFHTAYNIAGGGTTNDNSGNTPPPAAWYNVKEYNNDWINMVVGFSGGGWEVNGHSHGSSGAANVNEIYYFSSSSNTNGLNPYDCQDTVCSSYAYGHNLAYCAGGSCTVYGHAYGSGAFSSDPGNLTSNPLFTNYSSNDFSLQSGSPALNAGTYLTTVSSSDSGTGTSLIVNDAGYFQAGSPIPTVQGDCIAVTSVSSHVCITAINYATNTLTLSSSISRSVGAPVWLYSDSNGNQVLTGSAPNIGVPNPSSATTGSGSTPPAPVGLTSSAQ